MECDDEISTEIDDKQHPIATEARSVYKQLKVVCATLRSAQDEDSGIILVKKKNQKPVKNIND